MFQPSIDPAIRIATRLSFLIGLLAVIVLWPSISSAAADHTFSVAIPIALSAPAPTISINSQAVAVVALTNELRTKHGCPTLTISPELTTAAQNHSQDMASRNYFEHTSLNGLQPEDRAQIAGYAGMAGWENIAAGYASAADVVAGWYNETPPYDGHRQNMLNCSLTEIGVGYAQQVGIDYSTYWTEDFGQH